MFKLPLNEPVLFERFEGDREKRSRLFRKARGLAGATKHLMLEEQTYKVFRHTDAEGNRIKLHVWKDNLGERGILKVTSPVQEEAEIEALIYIESGWITDYTANLAPAELWLPDSLVERQSRTDRFLGTLKSDQYGALYWGDEAFTQGMDSKAFPGGVRGSYLTRLPCTGTGPLKKLQQVLAGSLRDFDAAALVAFNAPTMYSTTGFYRVPGKRAYRWVLLHTDDDMFSAYVQDATFEWPGSYIAALADKYETDGDPESASYLEGYLLATVEAPPDAGWVKASHAETRVYGHPWYHSWTWDDSGTRAYVATQDPVFNLDSGNEVGFRGYRSRGYTLTIQDNGWDKDGVPLVSIGVDIEGPKQWAPGRLQTFISVAYPGNDVFYGQCEIGRPTVFSYTDDAYRFSDQDGTIVHGWMGPDGTAVVHRVRNEKVRDAEVEDNGGLTENEYFPYLEHAVPGSHSGAYKQNKALYKVGIYGPGYELSGNYDGTVREFTETVQSSLTGSESGGEIPCEWVEGSTGPCGDPCRTGKISNDGTFRGNQWVTANPPSRTELGGGSCYGYSNTCWRVKRIDFAKATKTNITRSKGGDTSSAILIIPRGDPQSAYIAFQEHLVKETITTKINTSEGVGKVDLDVVTTNTVGYIKSGYSNTALCRNGDLAYSSMLPGTGYNFGAFCFIPDTRQHTQSLETVTTDPERRHKTIFVSNNGSVSTLHEETLTGANGDGWSSAWYQFCLDPFYLDLFETDAILPPLYSYISAWDKQTVKNLPPPGSSNLDSDQLPPGAYVGGGAWIGIV
jgi:hypothetical protein